MSTNATAWAEGAEPDHALAGVVSIESVRAAAARLDGRVHRTPVRTSRTLDARVGATVLLKCENFQRIGAFKFRGAFSALSNLDDDARNRGVITYSSGNHAQGVALAAAVLGMRAVIVMPQNAPRVKFAATRGYLEGAGTGSRIVEYDPATTPREELGRSLAERDGLTLVPPYDHPDVISGQGTVALELFEETGPLDRLYVCCGGGGLLSGCATVTRAVCPECEVIGVEPKAGDDANRSFETGRLCVVDNPDTIADGARTGFLGRYTFPIVLDRVDRMRTVTDRELAVWTLFCLERMRMVVEPSGVLGLAGLAADVAGEGLGGARVGVVISGGNLDLDAIGPLRKLASS